LCVRVRVCVEGEGATGGGGCQRGVMEPGCARARACVLQRPCAEALARHGARTAARLSSVSTHTHRHTHTRMHTHTHTHTHDSPTPSHSLPGEVPDLSRQRGRRGQRVPRVGVDHLQPRATPRAQAGTPTHVSPVQPRAWRARARLPVACARHSRTPTCIMRAFMTATWPEGSTSDPMYQLPSPACSSSSSSSSSSKSCTCMQRQSVWCGAAAWHAYARTPHGCAARCVCMHQRCAPLVPPATALSLAQAHVYRLHTPAHSTHHVQDTRSSAPALCSSGFVLTCVTRSYACVYTSAPSALGQMPDGFWCHVPPESRNMCVCVCACVCVRVRVGCVRA
jgi:hypothetical protein